MEPVHQELKIDALNVRINKLKNKVLNKMTDLYTCYPKIMKEKSTTNIPTMNAVTPQNEREENQLRRELINTC